VQSNPATAAAAAAAAAVPSSSSSARPAPIALDNTGDKSGGVKGWQLLRAMKASGIIRAGTEEMLDQGDQGGYSSKGLPRMQAMVYAAREAVATAATAAAATEAAATAAAEEEASSMALLKCWVSGAGGSTRTGHSARMVRGSDEKEDRGRGEPMRRRM